MGNFRGRDISVEVQFGLTSTPASFQARIKRFLRFYLGSENSPVPFGGRTAELNTLNDWLKADTPRNLLVTAPAGRGKTALLVHWIDQLNTDEWHIVFIPISIRYETNRAAIFYQALAARLATIQNDTLPATPSDPATFYKEKVIEYIDRFSDTHDRPCLIVIDGLDEATGWQVDPSVLPSDTPTGLRIVASARQLAGDQGSQDWLRRLGWTLPFHPVTTLEVPPLSREGISEVLLSMGFPLGDLAKDVDILTELFRLTEGGDPLLLQFYVADLWKRGASAARLRPEDLKSLEPGFSAYFRDWFEQQRKAWQEVGLDVDKEKLDGLLALLSCALGPIKLDAMSQIFQRMSGAKSFISRETLSPIGRFVIGDGVNSGFALGHPKLADFIQNDYFGGSQTIDDTRKAIVEWGRAILHGLESHSLRPDEVPEYCLLYYLQHLEELQPHSLLICYRELVEDGWRSAWLAHEEGLRGFARDLEVVFTRLRGAAENDPQSLKQARIGLGGLIRCILCLSSIRSIGAAVPAHFMAELVRQGLLSPKQALHLSRLKSEREQVETLKALGPCLMTDLEDAISDARLVRDLSDRADLLADLANHLTQPRRKQVLNEALETAERGQEGYARDALVKKIKQYLEPKTVDTDTITDTTEKIPVDTKLDHIADAKVPPAAPQSLLSEEEARKELTAVLSIRWYWERVSELRILACRLPQSVLSEALDALPQVESFSRADTLEALVPHLSPGLVRRAVQLVEDWDEFARARGLERLLPYLSPELLGQTLEHTQSWAEYYRNEALSILLPCLSPELINRAFELVQQWDEYYFTQGLSLLVPRMSPELFNRALETVLRLSGYYLGGRLEIFLPRLSPRDVERVAGELLQSTDSYARSGVKALIPRLSPEALDTALATILKWDRQDRSNVLPSLAPLLAPDRLRQCVAALSDSLPELDALLPVLPDEQRAATVASTYGAAFKIRDGIAFAAALVAIAESLPETEANEAISLAKAIADETPDPIERGLALLFTSCSQRISYARSRELLAEALNVAKQVSKPADRLAFECGALLVPGTTDAETQQIVSSALPKIEGMRKDEGLLPMYLMLLAPKLPDDKRAELLNRFKIRIADEKEGISFMLLGVLPRISESEALVLLNEGLARASQTDGEERAATYLLAALSPNLSVEQAEAFATQGLSLSSDMRYFFDAIRLPGLLEPQMVEPLRGILDVATKHSRAEVLSVLSLLEGAWLDLLGIVPRLFKGSRRGSCLLSAGGPNAVMEAFHSIRDVRRWWP